MISHPPILLMISQPFILLMISHHPFYWWSHLFYWWSHKHSFYWWSHTHPFVYIIVKKWRWWQFKEGWNHSWNHHRYRNQLVVLVISQSSSPLDHFHLIIHGMNNFISNETIFTHCNCYSETCKLTFFLTPVRDPTFFITNHTCMYLPPLPSIIHLQKKYSIA